MSKQLKPFMYEVGEAHNFKGANPKCRHEN